MKSFTRLGFYLLHPLWIPFTASLFYFLISPRYLPENFVKAKLLGIAILSIAIPSIFLSTLLKINFAKSIELREPKAKRLFLLCLCISIITINNFVIQVNLPELLFFFTAYLISLSLCLLLSLFRFQISLHSLAMSALVTFIISISLLYRINLVYWIAFGIFLIGWAASSRIGKEAHKSSEVWIGLLAGALPQIYFLYVALQHYKM